MCESTIPSKKDHNAGVRLVVLNLPEDEGEGLGFRLTRTLWDPYPWVREVTSDGRAATYGLRPGDCLLQVDGKDLLGTPVGQVATLIRGSGEPRGVSLLVWSCGVDPQDDPDLLWSGGGGARGERARRALSGVLRALSCCVCSATATKALCCARSHIYCDGCWDRLQRCALCRETLPAKESPYAKNLVAEQVFEAIATEYEIKENVKRPTSSTSIPPINRVNQYPNSPIQKHRKTVQFGDKYCPNYASDPNLSKSAINKEFSKTGVEKLAQSSGESSKRGNTASGDSCHGDICQKCSCHVDRCGSAGNIAKDSIPMFPHKLLTRLKPASSLADLQNSGQLNCELTKSLNNINSGNCCVTPHGGSLNNLPTTCGNTPIFLLSPTPVYVLACDHVTSSGSVS